MNLTEEQLEQLEDLAAACMKTREICMIMELDHDEFMNDLKDTASPVFIAHQKGFLTTKYLVNKKLIDLAKAGSSPAQTASIKLILEKELEDE